MSGFLECQQSLLNAAVHRGFLTFDEILDAASTFLLTASEIDRLSDNLQSQGVMLYETKPEQNAYDAEGLSDYSRLDYEAIFSEIISLSDSLIPLIDIIREIPSPQFGEVQTLVEQLHYGNDYARERLILSHLRVAVKIALSIAKQYNYDIEDAVSASLIGLTEAVEHFDPNGFSAFQSYASMWIRQNIHRYCNPVWMEFYYPVHIKEKMYPVLLKYNRDNGMRIDEREFDKEQVDAVAQGLGFAPNQVEHYLMTAYQQANGCVELDALQEESNEDMWVSSEQIETNAEYFYSAELGPYEQALEHGLETAMAELLESVKPREREILMLRYGFYDGVQKTLEEVGNVYGITRERVRQIENKTIRKLRHPSRAKRIKDFYY